DDQLGSPFTDVEQVLSFDPEAAFGARDRAATRAFLERRYADAMAEYPEEVNMTGTYVTLMSGLIDLFGWDLLLTACGEDAARFGEVANRYARWMQHYYDAMAETDIPAVMVHDDMVWTSGAFIHPDWYRKYLFPNYARYIRPLLDAGKKVLFISDGNYTQFLGDIAACGFHGFVLEPLTDMAEIAQKYGRTHVFIGNADTRILLGGTPEAIRAEVRRCMDIGKGCPGFFMAVGNHIPANTPVENCLIYEEAYREMCRR
ncbi:MAG: hypothetical protein GX558_06915, partial [Clostridiales bacterium]|nr:hypothetical protein [Clostridiales bacterium]